MSENSPPMPPEAPDAGLPLWRRLIRGGENSLLVAALAIMFVLPIAEIVARKFFGQGIKGTIPILQHLTLLVGVLGGAVAAREDRLLSLSTLPSFLKGPWQIMGRVASYGFAAGLSVLLAWASWDYVTTLRPTSGVLAYGIPIWVLQMFLPVGFAAVAGRLVWHVAKSWGARALALALAAVLAWLVIGSPFEPAKMVVPALVALAVATIFGAPIFTVLGGVALILFWGAGRPLTLLPLNHYELVTDPILPSVPLFTLTGYFLAEGGASRRLIRVFQAGVGWIRGGPAVMTVLVCTFFTSFTGASGVTIIALGGLLLPVLLAARFSEKASLGLLTGSGALGLLFPPCLPLILYAIIAQRTLTYLEPPPGMTLPEVGIKQVFLGGIGPGLLLVFLTSLWAVWTAPKERETRPPFVGSELWKAMWAAKWELLLPAGALGLILGGLATPVEAAAATALYAFLVETVVHRDLHLIRDVPRTMTECGLVIGGVLLILGMAMGLTNCLVFQDVPTKIVEWFQGSIHSRWMFLLVLNLFLLVVGCLMDIFSATIVVVPLIVPLGLVFGVDPVHLGIIFLANLQLGYLTPPVGMNLFLASYRFHKPVMEIVRATLSILLVQAIGVLLITYVPPLTTFLPRLIGK